MQEFKIVEIKILGVYESVRVYFEKKIKQSFICKSGYDDIHEICKTKIS